MTMEKKSMSLLLLLRSDFSFYSGNYPSCRCVDWWPDGYRKKCVVDINNQMMKAY